MTIHINVWWKQFAAGQGVGSYNFHLLPPYTAPALNIAMAEVQKIGNVSFGKVTNEEALQH